MAVARIFQQSKNAMQSGKAGTDEWVLEFESAAAQRPDPLTGWAGGADTQSQVRLRFASAEGAKAYARSKGLDYHYLPAPPRKLRLQSYADNFR